jgi:hypothetical protein
MSWASTASFSCSWAHIRLALATVLRRCQVALCRSCPGVAVRASIWAMVHASFHQCAPQGLGARLGFKVWWLASSMDSLNLLRSLSRDLWTFGSWSPRDSVGWAWMGMSSGPPTGRTSPGWAELAGWVISTQVGLDRPPFIHTPPKPVSALNLVIHESLSSSSALNPDGAGGGD